MKKLLISITAILLISASLILWQKQSYSETNLPYPEPPQTDNPPKCVQSIVNQMTLMKDAWNQNLQTMMDQQKPCSEMVDEAFESMRTYRCWLDYLCETVLLSSNMDPETGKTLKISTQNIDPIPGCTAPENIEIPGASLKYLPSCQVGAQNTVADAQANFASCRKLVNLDFSELTDPASGSKNAQAVKDFKNQSEAYIKVEDSLNQCSARQKGNAVGNKLTELISKMFTMENHMLFLKEQVQNFDARLPCYVPKCD